MAHVGDGGVESWSLWDRWPESGGVQECPKSWTVPLVPHHPISVQSWRIGVGKNWLPAAGVYYKTSLTLAQVQSGF